MTVRKGLVGGEPDVKAAQKLGRFYMLTAPGQEQADQEKSRLFK